MYSVPALPMPGVLADPSAFFTSPEGEAWIGTLADNFPHTRYWRERSDCWSLKSLNALGARIIDARYDGHEVEEAMEAEYPAAEFGETWYHEIAPQLRGLLDAAGVNDDGDAVDVIRYAWEDHAADRDDSSVSALFASYDRCELLFRFSAEQWLDDSKFCRTDRGPMRQNLPSPRTCNLRWVTSATPSPSSARPAATATPPIGRYRIMPGAGVRQSLPTSCLPKLSTTPARPHSCFAFTPSCRSPS